MVALGEPASFHPLQAKLQVPWGGELVGAGLWLPQDKQHPSRKSGPLQRTRSSLASAAGGSQGRVLPPAKGGMRPSGRKKKAVTSLSNNREGGLFVFVEPLWVVGGGG